MPPGAAPDDFEGWETRDEEGEGGFSLPHFLLDPLGIARRRWPWMLGILAVGAVATAVVVATAKPTFEAKATLLITSQQIPEDFVRSTVREDTIGNVDTMFGEVMSRPSLLHLIEEHHLYPDAGDGVSDAQLVERMRSNITAAPAVGFTSRGYRASVIYEIAFEHENPKKAADVANALAGLFVESSIMRRTEQARRTTSFLRKALASDEAELRQQSGRVSEFRREHRGELPDELDTNLRKLDLATQRRESLTAAISAKENYVATLTAEPGSLETSENQALLAEMRRDLARELAAHTEEHPNVAALRRRIARLEEVVAEEQSRPLAANSALQRALTKESFELSQLHTELRETEQQIAALNASIDRTPAVGDELDALAEVEEVLREKYLAALRKVEDAELAERLESAQQGAQVSTLDRAQEPTAPKRPRWMLVAGGTGGTLVLAVALAVLLELIDPVVLDVRQLETIADRPALGSLPRIA